MISDIKCGGGADDKCEKIQHKKIPVQDGGICIIKDRDQKSSDQVPETERICNARFIRFEADGCHGRIKKHWKK